MLEESGNRPTWYGVCASYLRGFARYRDSPTDGTMPADRRLSEAVRRLYDGADPAERAVMDGTLKGREGARIFDRLAAKLAVLAGIVGYAMTVKEERNGKINEHQSKNNFSTDSERRDASTGSDDEGTGGIRFQQR